LDSVSQRVFSYEEDTAIAPLVKDWPKPPPEEHIDTASDADTSSGGRVYRIQLYTTKNRAEATAMRDEAKVDFGDEVRLDFETPYYKLRIGTFANPEEADELLRKARRLGYRGAWVVRVRAPSGKQ
jgi:cell division septation protein DedD